MRLHDHLDYFARERPDAGFVADASRRLTYAEGATEANRVANALIGAGLEAGERIALLAHNCADYMVLYYGASKAGVVPVPLNYRLAPLEWAYIVNDSDARLLVARGDCVPEIDRVRGELKNVRRFLALDGPVLPGWEDFRAFASAGGATPPGRAVSSDQDVYQMYTSGTTGHPKGAVLTHRAVTANVSQGLTAIRVGREAERFLTVAPLYHAAAAVTSFLAVGCGGSIRIHEEFDPAAVVEALATEGITRTTLVPAMIQACLVTVPGVAERAYEDLRMIIYGASPIAEETLRRALQVFGCEFVQGYGMTETTAALTYLMPEDHRRALEREPRLLLSAGRALPGTEIRIVDEEDRPVPNGVVGEIVGRGPQLMRGYWNLPESSAEALRGGWMHTGDAGVLDDEGFLYVQDRVKDMIVSGGENVYPREIEDVLFRHPSVADAAVIGVPDEEWGEVVKALVVRRDASLAEEDLVAWCREHLGGFKRPRSVDFVDALPRNPSGKVLKRELREPYWRGHARRVS